MGRSSISDSSLRFRARLSPVVPLESNLPLVSKGKSSQQQSGFGNIASATHSPTPAPSPTTFDPCDVTTWPHKLDLTLTAAERNAAPCSL